MKRALPILLVTFLLTNLVGCGSKTDTNSIHASTTASTSVYDNTTQAAAKTTVTAKTTTTIQVPTPHSNKPTPTTSPTKRKPTKKPWVNKGNAANPTALPQPVFTLDEYLKLPKVQKELTNYNKKLAKDGFSLSVSSQESLLRLTYVCTVDHTDFSPATYCHVMGCMADIWYGVQEPLKELIPVLKQEVLAADNATIQLTVSVFDKASKRDCDLQSAEITESSPAYPKFTNLQELITDPSFSPLLFCTNDFFSDVRILTLCTANGNQLELQSFFSSDSFLTTENVESVQKSIDNQEAAFTSFVHSLERLIKEPHPTVLLRFTNQNNEELFLRKYDNVKRCL